MKNTQTISLFHGISPERAIKSIGTQFLLTFLMLLTVSIQQASATTCCPDFIIKDLVEICPPGGACAVGDDADGHHQDAVPAACKESIHTYTVYPNDPTIYTYQWTVIGGTPSSFTGNPIEIEWGTGNIGYITVVINGSNGCEATLTKEICLIDGPEANFTFNPDPVCENTPIQFTNLSVGGGEYFWDFGDGTISTLFNPVHSYAAAGVYEVTLTVTDFGESVESGEFLTACGCSDSITFTVEVLEGQGPIIESDCCDGTICPGETSTFYTNVVCTSYNWSVSGGTIIAGAGTSEIVVEWDAAYSVPTTVSLETPGCADTPCAGITTIDVPVLYPNLPIAGDTNFCQGANGNYSIPSMPGTYYTWTVSGGDYSINSSDLNSSNINVSFISPGTFTIEVEYDNPLAGCSGSSSIVVEVLPIFRFTGEDLVCEDNKEVYTANGDVSSWLVSPTGPSVDPVSSISAEVTWDNAGIYLITAQAANPAQFCNPSSILQVEVVSPPLLDPIAGPTVVCPDRYLTYFISSDTEGSFFNWSIMPAGSGTIFSEMGADKDSIVVAFYGAGPWTLEVYQEIEIAPGLTCVSDTETLVIEAHTPPVITSQSGNTEVCVDAIETYFTSLPVPQGGYTWEINPPNRGTIVSGQGTEEVEIRWHGPPANATLSVSSCAGADQIQLTIVDPPFIDPISADGPTLYCLPDVPNNLTLSTSLDPSFTYQWFLNNQPIPGANTHQYTIVSHPPIPATYAYVVEASNGSCTITRQILVVIDDDCNGTPPTFECLLDFSINPDPACAGQPITLNVILPPATPPAINPGFYQFEWTFGDGSTSFTEVTQKSYDTPGVYDITLVGYNNICTLQVIKQVTVNPLPICSITATDTIFCPGDSLLLEACPNMLGYQWYREGNPIPGADQQTYWATQHGLYQVEATNQFGCSDLSEGVYIFSHSLPRAKISGDQSICANAGWFFNMALSTPYDPDYSYEWSSSLAGATFNPNNGNNAASTNVLFQLPNPLPTQISFYVSVTDMTTGCVNTDTLCVTVNQIPFIQFDSWVTECEGTPVTFTPSVIDTSQYHYLWSNGATTPEITVSSPGFYVLQVTDKFSGCTFNAAAGVINPLPDVSLFPTGCATLEIDEVLDLYIPLPLSSTAWNNTIPIAYPSIEWFDTDGNPLGSGENLAFSSSTDGYFEVYAVVENYHPCEAITVVFCITVLPESDDPEPAITVTKTLTSINGDFDQTAFTLVGDVLTYNIEVCNTGNVALFNVGVMDPLTGLSEIINLLDVGDCATFTTSYTITQDDLDLCEFENFVFVYGEDENGNDVADTDVEIVPCEDTFVPDPGLTVTKTLASINDDPNQTAFTQVGDILTFTIVVTNTGNVPLTNVVVDDPVTGDTWTIPVLNPGDSQTFTTLYTITQGELDNCVIRNFVTATGDDPDGNQVNDSDFVDVPCGEDAQNPDIEVTKTLVSINNDTNQTAFTQVGDVLTYDIVVCNTGNITLINVLVEDPLTGLTGFIQELLPGDCETFTTSYTITMDDLSHCEVVNVVNASGNTQDDTQVVDSDEETVPCEEQFIPDPGLTVTKTLASINDDPNQTAFTQVGDILTFTIVVTNTGNVPLTNVVVDDPVTGDTWTIPVLNPGDSQTFTATYTITQGNIDNCVIRNFVNATGDDPDGNQVSDGDVISVPCDPEGQHPDISVTKNLSDINGDSSITSYTQVGDVLTYTIVVTNTGSVTLFNVVVTDPLTGLSQTIPVMAPGDSVTLTTSYTITQADLDDGYVLNTVTATGSDASGNTVSDDDFEIVPGCIEELHPQLTVTKFLSDINGSADQTTFSQVGDVLTYTITVTNTGNITLSNVVIIDPMTGLNHAVPGSLAPGDSVTVTTSYTIQQFDLDKCFLLNLGYATGEDPDGNVVNHSDFEIVECEEDLGLYDFGDAPEGAIAYPPSTIGFFPTCTNTGPPGSFVRHSGNHELFFGESVDYEIDGNAGNCPNFSPNLYDQDECFEDGDAGLITPRAYTITGPVGSESIVPCTAGWSWFTWFTCSRAVWGRTVDIYVTNNLPNGATAYVNLLVDWNMNGEWGGSVPCSGNNLAHEHALVNFPVPNGFSGPLSQLSPPSFRIGPEAGYVWTRFSVTETPVVQGWDGSGSFDFGETEDYLIRTRPLIIIPVDWFIGGVSVALDEEVCFSALDNIVAGGEEGPFVVEDGGAAELGAGRSIRLLEGVRVEAGGYFHARIVTDDDYCIWEEGVETAAEPVGPTETIEDTPVPEPLELPETFGFRVFPNPTNGMLNVELLPHTDSQNIRIEIYNMMGERVFWKEESVASHYELDLSSQPPGMYFIRVSDGTSTETQRVVRR